VAFKTEISSCSIIYLLVNKAIFVALCSAIDEFLYFSSISSLNSIAATRSTNI